MNSYRITNTISGLVLGIYEGEDEMAALDAMARDAGFRNYAESCKEYPEIEGEMLVEAVIED